MPIAKKTRFLALVCFVIVWGIVLLLVPRYASRLRPSWFELGGACLLLTTGYSVLWANRNNRISAALIISVLGNIVLLASILVPFNGDKSIVYKDAVLKTAVLLYIISFLVRLVSSWRVLKKTK